MTETTEKTFEGWAIVELMGHRRLAGYVTETELAGAPMLRLDVPEHPWVEGCTCGSDHPESLDHEEHKPSCRMFREEGDDRPLDVYATQFYAPAALYCLTPTTEETARAVRARPTPVHVWEVPRPRELVAAGESHEPDDEHDRDDEIAF